MNERTTRNLLITLMVLIAVGLTYFVVSGADDKGQASQQNNSSDVTLEETPNVEPAESKGKISGSFTYPGENIPSGMMACVEDAETREKIGCTEEQIKDDRFIYGVGYEIEVDAGKYYVYVDQGETKAYFNGYVAQVTKEDGWPDYDINKCKSDYQPIVVSVESGKESNGATLADWYYETNCS